MRSALVMLIIGAVFVLPSAVYGHEVKWKTGIDWGSMTQCSMSMYELRDTYVRNFDVNPYFLRLDINGDGRMDYAIRVTNRKNKKLGLAICLALPEKNGKKDGKLDRILFAGNPVKEWSPPGTGSRMSDDISSDLISWHQIPKDGDLAAYDENPKVPRPKGEIILMSVPETDAGFFLYWTGKEYIIP